MTDERPVKVIDQSGRRQDEGVKILKQPGVQIDRGDTGRVAMSRVERDYGPGPREGVGHPGHVEIEGGGGIEPGTKPGLPEADERTAKPKP